MDYLSIFGPTDYGKSHIPLMGGKGAHLAELHNLGLPVPPLVNLTTEAYREWLDPAADDYIEYLAQQAIMEFQDREYYIGKSILVSVRSGAPVSMPGMMDTILNVGLSLDTQEEWEDEFGPEWFWDSYSRLLVQLAGVLGIENLPTHDAQKGFRVAQKISLALTEAGHDIDELTTPMGAMGAAIQGVFNSWQSDRAKVYREIHNIDGSLGTACSIQMMVFGNLNEQSGTGVLFTRCPSSGVNLVAGEFLVQAQGEDVVDGSTTPMPLSELGDTTLDKKLLEELIDVAEKLEDHFSEVQDIEFTIENDKLWVLQTRTAKRTSAAAFRIVTEMVDEGIIGVEDAIARITPADWYNVHGRTILNAPEPDFKGLAAGSGIAQGRAVFTSQEAVDANDPVILVRPETTPDDIAGMFAAEGIVTFEGGMTSHAAVVARGMNKPCIVGAGDMYGNTGAEDIITLDSAEGHIWVNAELEITDGEGDYFADLLVRWAQAKDKSLARRNEYVSHTILKVAALDDIDFVQMISSVETEGGWLERVVLDMSATPSFNMETDALGTLAKLSLPHTLLHKMHYRRAEIDKLAAKGFPTMHTDGIKTMSSPAGLLDWLDEIQDDPIDQLVTLNLKNWKQFLGGAYEGTMAILKKRDTRYNVLDFCPTEAELIKTIFGGTE